MVAPLRRNGQECGEHRQLRRASFAARREEGFELIELPFDGNGYNCEAEEVKRCLDAGVLESEVMPLDETLSVMGTLDGIRAQIGLKYPME